ncbi:DUF2089 family protein [Parabacteroides sp. 52]|uniref:DUF2089 family protein n=1 Tax=unclassified Parabacteroides TaxID=2649774 RepID=UPI0013D8903E|nr:MULTISPECIES: DUF2089 family protein [unclassified Parabacteroides]MDH6533828.1 hypothetical protein [Parabacteroides sp. PM5-20]NDV54578.1 DUF2089 family protein [Parabacteroides sp. 52]
MSEFVKKLPLKCPSCDSPLHVKKLHCIHCDTEVNGSFALPLFVRLSEKEQAFILDFVKSSGSLKDMAKNMGISYPTVRNLLDDLIEKLRQIEEV